MNIFDERVRFFLKHRAQIEEWIALADASRTASEKLLFGVVEELRAWASEQAPRLEVSTQPETDWPKILVHRPEWLLESPVPEVSVAIEWSRPNLDLGHDTRCPGVGLRVRYEVQPDGPARSADLKQRAKDAKLLVAGTRSTTYFPVYRSIPATNMYWEDPGPYAARLIEAVRTTWQATEPIIAASLAAKPLKASG